MENSPLGAISQSSSTLPPVVGSGALVCHLPMRATSTTAAASARATRSTPSVARCFSSALAVVAAARSYQRRASAGLTGTPWPRSYISPR